MEKDSKNTYKKKIKLLLKKEEKTKEKPSKKEISIKLKNLNKNLEKYFKKLKRGSRDKPKTTKKAHKNTGLLELSKKGPLKKEVEKNQPKPEIKKEPIINKKILKQRIKNYIPAGAKKPSSTEINGCANKINKLKKEISKVIVGQEKIINALIRGIICDGHILLEGIPGIAKTLAIKALGKASGCSVKRVQFTVDLLPTDILGLTTYTPEKGFEIIKGPLFSNFIIADEINRSPPKTQSALIEAMQEKQATIGKERFLLPSPFFVMATKNPIENAGVYTLPEAQTDRFLFKLKMDYPSEEEENRIMEQNVTLKKFDDYKLNSVVTPEDIIKMQKIVKKIYLGDSIKSYILSIVKKTRDKEFKFADCISYGASPRASIAMFIASKSRALMKGRNYVIPEDVKEIAYDVLRHRIILSYKATIQKIESEDIIKTILEETGVP